MIKTRKLLSLLFILHLLANCTKTQYINTKITVPPQHNIGCVARGFIQPQDNMSMDNFATVLIDVQCLKFTIKTQEDYIDLLLNIMNQHNSVALKTIEN